MSLSTLATIIAHRAPACVAAAANRHWRAAAGRLASACPLCGNGAHGGRLCPGCQRELMEIERGRVRCARCACDMQAQRMLGLCGDCRGAPPAFDAAFVAFDYAPPGDLLVRHLKDNLLHGLAPTLAGLIDDAVRRREPVWPSGTVVVPVPASRRSLRRRGFNPAGEIARALAQSWRLRRRLDYLARIREGPKQSTLSARARRLAADDLFAGKAVPRGCDIVLVDDVITTGSTLDAAARALRQAGAGRITAVAVARTP